MRTIPHKDTDFDVVQEVIISVTTENAEAWMLDAEWLTKELQPAAQKWASAWLACQPAATRTPLITFAKNEARRKYEPLLRRLVQSLRGNVRVSHDDLKKMGIAIPQRGRTVSPVPETYPVFTVDSGTIRRLSIHFRDSAATSSAKPHGVHGAEIKWGMDAVPQAGPDAFPHSSFDTHTPFTLQFTEPDRGKTVYFCLRWENKTGIRGPWGEIGMAIIP